MTCSKRKSTVLGWVRSKYNENRKWLFQTDCVTGVKKGESAMYGTLIIVVSTSTDATR